jgi:addiction module RelE/StbE family toxin
MTPWARPALKKLFAIYERIARENPAAAAELIHRIYEAANYLQSHPKLGRQSGMLHLRELVVPNTPYILLYRLQGREALIINIQHGRQQDFPRSK